MATSCSAADLVAAGVQDACEDACSICLEPFSQEEPPTLTACQHSFHLQCVLEWAQRRPRIECPMCWQPLALQDEAAAQLLAGEDDHAAAMRPASAPATFPSFLHQPPTQLPSDRHLDQRLLHHLAAAVTRSRHAVALARQAPPGVPRAPPARGPPPSSSPPPGPPLSTFSPPLGVAIPVRSSPAVLLESGGGGPGGSPVRGGGAESLKVRLAAATRGYKETAGPKITKGFRWLLSAFNSPDAGAAPGPSSAPSSSSPLRASRAAPPPADQSSMPPAPAPAPATPPSPPPSCVPGGSQGASPPADGPASSPGPPSRVGHQRSASNLTRELQKMALETRSESLEDRQTQSQREPVEMRTEKP